MTQDAVITHQSILITVIIPVYNVKPYLNEAIRSVLNQTYTNLEIIIVDDGSTDGSGEICDRFSAGDSRVRVIHQKHSGLSAARNKGLDVCTGELIAFLDPDDALCGNALMSMYKVLTKYEADIVECRCSVYRTSHIMDSHKTNKRSNKRPIKSVTPGIYTKPDIFRMKIDGKLSFSAWNKLYRRRLWNDLRYPVGRNYEDVDVIIPLLTRAERFYLMDDSLIMHRIRPGSITRTYTVRNIKDKILSYEHYIGHLKSLVPEYLNEDDISMAYKALLRDLLFCYVRQSVHIFPDRRNYLSYYAKEINNMSAHVPLEYCGARIRICLVMVNYFPPFMTGLLYRIYRPFRVLWLKVLRQL